MGKIKILIEEPESYQVIGSRMIFKADLKLCLRELDINDVVNEWLDDKHCESMPISEYLEEKIKQ